MWRHRLRQLDPGLRVTRRAVRVTVAACVGFYVARYLLHQPVLATYALFTVLALGVLSQIPGPPVVVDPGLVAAEDWPTNLGHDLYHLADLRVWLDGLGNALTHITVSSVPPHRPS